MARISVYRLQDGAGVCLAEVDEEYQAINWLTDCAYNALVDGQCAEFSARRVEEGDNAIFARVNVHVTTAQPRTDEDSRMTLHDAYGG